MSVSAVEVPVLDGKEGDKEAVRSVRAHEMYRGCVRQRRRGEARGWECPGCRQDSAVFRQFNTATCLDVLVVHANQFHLVMLVPTRLYIVLILPLDDYLGHDLQPGEKDVAGAHAAIAQPQFGVKVHAQLEVTGFLTMRCHRALFATVNNGTQVAMGWLLARTENHAFMDIDAPPHFGSSGAGGALLVALVSMSFT